MTATEIPVGMAVDAVGSLKRYVAFKTVGTARYLLAVQAFLDDSEGYTERGESLSAAIAARRSMLEALSILGLRTEGEVAWGQYDLTFNYFQGAPPDEVERVLDLNRRSSTLEPDESGAWVAEVRSFIEGIDVALDHDDPVPVLRTPRGMFPTLSLARRWQDVADELGLPPFIPGVWRGAE